MKALPIFLLLFVTSMSFGQVVPQPDAKLLNAALQQYLKEMNTAFNITPNQFIIEAADKSVYQNVNKKVGNTTIVVKTKKELQAYSSQNKGKSIGFFVIDVEKVGANYSVDIMDDGIKAVGTEFSYDSFGAGRACVLTFNSNFVFQNIDCLLLPTDPK